MELEARRLAMIGAFEAEQLAPGALLELQHCVWLGWEQAIILA
jgi:hypothetical protein